MLLLWLRGIQGGSASSTLTQVCAHIKACTTQTDVWQIALLRLCKIPMVVLLQVDCQFLSCTCLRNMLLLSVWIQQVAMSHCTLFEWLYPRVNSDANWSAFLRVSYDILSALQTGWCAWLNLCWQVKPLLHKDFSVCSYCVMTTFEPLWATLWDSFGREEHLPLKHNYKLS